jgi:hypothetical protein
MKIIYIDMTITLLTLYYSKIEELFCYDDRHDKTMDMFRLS